MKIIFATHAATIGNKSFDGLGNILTAAFEKTPHETIHIQHSIDGGLKSKIVKISQKPEQTLLPQVLRQPKVLRWILEFFVSVFFISKSNATVFVGVDPLNAIAGIFSKIFNRKLLVVFFVADYSPKRFSNTFLNWTYHFIEKVCVRKADQIWAVSSRIKALIEDWGISPNKIVLTPNTPPSSFKNFQENKKNKYTLVTTGLLQYQLDFHELFLAVKILASEEPRTRLMIIGEGEQLSELKILAKQLSISHIVEFAGHQPLDKTLYLISSSGIGLALYTGVWGFNFYGDSTKAREYLYYGLPVITTDSHSTVEEIYSYNAGKVVTVSSEEYVEAIREIWQSYSTYSSNSKRLGTRYGDIHLTNLESLVRQKTNQ